MIVGPSLDHTIVPLGSPKVPGELLALIPN